MFFILGNYTFNQINETDMSEQKRVWIHRVEPNNRNLPDEVRKNATRRLASVFNENKPLKGLDHEEEKELLPRLINADPDEGSTFFEKADKFWKEFSVNIPSGGKTLDISTREPVENDKGEEVVNPTSVKDYVTYRFARNHPQVAENKQEALKNRTKYYYILDPEEEKQTKKSEVEAKKQAWREFIKIEEDADKINLMIRVFTDEKPEQMSDKDEKINKLHDELERRPKEFVELVTDDDLEKQDFVLQCIENGVLRKVGNQIMYMDEVIGNGIDQVVAYLKNDRNSSTYNELKAKLESARS